MRSRSQVDEGSTEDLAPPVLQPQTSTTTTPLCSICLDTVENAVETNCGHRFCAQCILMHWNRDRYPQPCRCPNCRRDVTLMLPCDELGREVSADVSAFNHRMSGEQGGLISRVRDAPVLLQHLRQDLFRTGGGLPCTNKLYFLILGVAVLAYLISPFDLIPEAIFGIFGYLDDIVGTIYMGMYAAAVYRTYLTSVSNQQQT